MQSWPFDAISQASISEARHGQATIVIRTGSRPWNAVSMFFDARQAAPAERVITEIGKRLWLLPQ
jgi:hypothetical protein